MNDSIFLIRQQRLAEGLRRSGVEAAALNPSPTLVYLTGLNFHLSERPVVALFAPGKPVTIVLPELELRKVDRLPFPTRAVPYGENPRDWPDVFAGALQSAGLERASLGLEPTRFRFLELQLLQTAAPQVSFVSAGSILAELRMCKDTGELAAMRTAVEIAQQALLATLPVIKPGVTERQIASELVLQLLRHGSDSEFPFSPIVSGGPNSANPHATPTDRPLQTGDLLVIDWGAIHAGYVSDLTRTFSIGQAEPEYQVIAKLVEQANAAGRQAARPGIPAEAVDQAARRVIEAGGYGAYFTHRTGHGLGMQGHEHPYIYQGNALILQPGMTFTVEPGIYLPERGGVRIEDNIVITESGAESLSNLSRPLRELPA